MDDEIRTSMPEDDQIPTHDTLDETELEEPIPFLQREMQIFRTYLARLGLILMYLSGLTIIGLGIYEGAFHVTEYDSVIGSITQMLIAGAGGFIMAVTTWMWKKAI